MKVISSSDAFLLFQKWFEERRLLSVNTFTPDGSERRFTVRLTDVLPRSQTLMALAGETEVAFPFAGATFALADERDTGTPEAVAERWEFFLQADWPSGNRALFGVPREWVRDLQVELKPPDVPPNNLQTHH